MSCPTARRQDMPTNLSIADSSFPQLTKQQSNDEKFDKIQSYLYMLLESLRFSLSNLDKDNFNETGLTEISDMITEPVYAQISDVEGNVTSLALTAEGLSTRISDAEGNINTLSVRADSLTSRITSVEGDVSTLNQTATSLTTRIADAEGDVSVLQQTAVSLSSRISNAEADISLIQQTADSLTLAVVNGETSSVIRLKAGETQLSSQTIKFTGIVTFSDLSTSGKTTINGGNITTGTISAISLSGNTITGGTISGATISGSTIRTLLSTSGTIGGELEFHYGSSYGSVYGGIRLDDQGAGTAEEMKKRLFIYTKNPFALKLDSETRMSIEADWSIYIAAGSAHIGLSNDGTISLTGTVKVNGTTIGG